MRWRMLLMTGHSGRGDAKWILGLLEGGCRMGTWKNEEFVGSGCIRSWRIPSCLGGGEFVVLFSLLPSFRA